MAGGGPRWSPRSRHCCGSCEEWPYTVWPLQGIAVGLAAAAAVWCFDETAAAVVDTLPRGLAWRTLARLLGVVLVLGVWLVSVSWTSTAYFGRQEHVAWQGVAAVVAGSAYTTWRRSRGTATPGLGVATALVCGASYLALARPLDDGLPVFPYLASGRGRPAPCCGPPSGVCPSPRWPWC